MDAKRKLDLPKISCSSHFEETCIVYCQECKIPICLSCILEKHSGHRATKIEVVYDNQRTELEQFRDAVKLDLSKCAERTRYLHERKQDDLNRYTAIKENILDREKEMKDSVTTQVAQLIKDLDELYLSDNQFITKEEEHIKKYEKDLKSKKAKVEKVLDTCHSASVLDTKGTIDFKIPTHNFKELPKDQAVIFTEVEPEMNLNLKVLKAEHIIELIEVYYTGESTISNLKTSKNGTYVMMSNEYRIMPFIFQDGKFKCSKVIILDVLDLTVSNEGHILVSRNDSEEIYTLTDSGLESFKSIASPRQARGIHLFGKQTLFVGFIDSPIREAGIAIIDLKTNQNQEFTFEEEWRPNYIPEKIASDINGDICVIQTENKATWNGRIVSFEIRPSLGQVKWIYKGHDHINMVRDFSPRDIVITSTGLVFTVDDLTSIVHVLSTNGSFLTFIGAREGVYFPNCLNVDIEGHLQIGSFESNGESAKIYVAKCIQ